MKLPSLFGICLTLVSVEASKHHYVTKTLQSLQNASLFYEKNFKEVNLDSIFGLRAAEGALHNLIRHHQSELAEYGKNVDGVYQKIHRIAVTALSHLKRTGDAYYYAFSEVVSKRWYYESPLRPPSRQLPKSEPIADEISEEFSDQCMRDLLGTQNVHSKEKCVVNYECWKAMTRFGATGYYLTHQALFFILTDVNDCMSDVEMRYGYKKDAHFTYLGSQILSQMTELYQKGVQTAEDRDLFLEQGVVCKWLGIDSCFNLEWLEAALTWQDPSGCIRETQENDEDEEEENMADENDDTKRKLLMEQTVSGGCLSHATGLYVAYIAASLHWLLTKCKNDIFLAPVLSVNPKLIYSVPFFFVFLVLVGRYCKRRMFCRNWRLI